jgi:hypothetical protein
MQGNNLSFALVFARAVLNEGASPHPLEASYHFKSKKAFVMSELIKLVEATIENRKSEYPELLQATRSTYTLRSAKVTKSVSSSFRVR